MMRRSVFAVLLLCTWAVHAATWSQKVTLKNPQNGYMHADIQAIPVLKNGATFTLEADSGCTFQMCYSWLIRAPDEIDDEWAKMCQFIVPGWTSKQDPVTSFWVNPGMGHINLYTSKSSCSATITVSGESCDIGGYGPDCVGTSPFPDQTEIPPGDYILFEAEPDNQWWTNLFEVTLEEAHGNTFDFYYREGDAPRPAYDGQPAVTQGGGRFTGSGTISISNPRNLGHEQSDLFIHIFGIKNPNDNAITVTATKKETACDRFLYGASCKYEAPPLLSEYAYQIPNEVKEWRYGSIILASPAGPMDSFSMGVTTLDGQEAPAMYLRYGGIPDADNYDMKIGKYTSETRFYFSGITLAQSGRWFWGAHVARSAQKGSYGMWFNAECPNSCSEHGSCDSETHECVCDKGFRTDWFTCALEDGPDYQSPVKDEGSDGGMGATEITFIVLVSLESLIIVMMLVGVGLYAYSKYVPKGEVDREYEEL